MGWISVVFVHKAINAATEGEQGGDQRRRDLFRSVGVDPDAPVDPKLMAPDTDFFALLERLTAATALRREVCQEAFLPVAVHFIHDAPRDNTMQEAFLDTLTAPSA
jgi:hypothetical protein